MKTIICIFALLMSILQIGYSQSSQKNMSTRDSMTSNSYTFAPRTLDYNDPGNWIAHPMKGRLDMDFTPSFTYVKPNTSLGSVVTVKYDTASNFDVFCVHPTALIELASPAHNVMVNVQYKLAANLMIKWLFSQFAQFGRIYAPYYRQGTLATFNSLGPNGISDSLQAEILETATNDIIAAFEYYIQNNNKGKRIILVGHSQGSYILAMVLRKLESNPSKYQSYLNRIFLSVLAGMPGGPFVLKATTKGGWWQMIPICQNPLDTACVMSWATYKDDGNPFSSIPTGNRVVLNNYLVRKGFMYKTFDSLSHNILFNSMGFIPSKQVTYSIYPKADFFFPTATYGVTTDFIGYADMYQGRISNPDASNYGVLVKRPLRYGDLRYDPLEQSQTNNLHDYDLYVIIGDAINLIWQKIKQSTTDIKMDAQCPCGFILYQNYPNPFNSTTTIRFTIPQREHVTLQVFDMLGRKVVTLVNEELNPGEHSIIFDAIELASNIFYYRLQTNKYFLQKKIALIK